MCSSISYMEVLTVGFPYGELISVLLYFSGVFGLSIKYIIFYLTHLEKTSLKGNFYVLLYNNVNF